MPPIGAIVGWIVHRIVVEGDTNLRDDIDAARRRPATESPPPAAS